MSSDVITQITRLEFGHEFYRFHCLTVDIIECIVLQFILIVLQFILKDFYISIQILECYC